MAKRKNASLGKWINSTARSLYPKTLANTLSGKKSAGQLLDELFLERPRMSAADRAKTRRLEGARAALLAKAEAKEKLRQVKANRVASIKLARLRLARTIRNTAQEVRSAETALRTATAATRKASRPSRKAKAPRKGRKGAKGTKGRR